MLFFFAYNFHDRWALGMLRQTINIPSYLIYKYYFHKYLQQIMKSKPNHQKSSHHKGSKAKQGNTSDSSNIRKPTSDFNEADSAPQDVEDANSGFSDYLKSNSGERQFQL